jgi:hypothetical protein
MNVESFVLFTFPLVGTPVMVGFAWWAWSRNAATSLSSRWRTAVILIGLTAVSLDAAIYYGWFAYRTVTDGSAAAWSLKETLADNIGIPLAAVGLTGGAFGKSSARLLVLLSAVAEVLLWSNFGIL